MTYFTSEYLKFFEDLTKKNNKAWFDENRKRYEEHVKRPFEAFVDEMIDQIKAEDPEVAITAKDAIFRINKDIRFSKDKSLYKTHMAANVSKEGRRSKEWPGFYFQFGADWVAIGGGSYVVEPPTLLKIRKAIARDVPGFQRLVRSKAFTSAYGSLQGERNKVMPPEFREAVGSEPLVANKQFYYMTNLDPSILLKKDLPKRLLNYYQAGRDINAFLKRAMRGK